MIGKDAQRRQDESAVERADGECRPVGADQLFETFELPLVIAQNHGRRRLGHDLPQKLQVAVDMLGWDDREALFRLRIRNREARQAGQRRTPRGRIDQQLVTRRGFFSHATGHFQMMRGISPGTLDLARDGGFLIGDDDSIGREEIQQVRTEGRSMLRPLLQLSL